MWRENGHERVSLTATRTHWVGWAERLIMCVSAKHETREEREEEGDEASISRKSVSYTHNFAMGTVRGRLFVKRRNVGGTHTQNIERMMVECV